MQGSSRVTDIEGELGEIHEHLRLQLSVAGNVVERAPPERECLAELSPPCREHHEAVMRETHQIDATGPLRHARRNAEQTMRSRTATTRFRDHAASEHLHEP